MNEDAKANAVLAQFNKTINESGFGFQYAVISRIRSLFEQQKTHWAFEVSEFPVEVRKSPTRIDFILRQEYMPFQMIAECKRANPAFSDWCFLRAPYVRRGQSQSPVLFESLYPASAATRTAVIRKWTGAESFHVAFAVKTDRKGNTISRPEEIEGAATQVMRGMNGYLDWLQERGTILAEAATAFLPVVFTTANLWATSADLSLGDLHSGNIDISTSRFEKRAWLLYQYPASPGLRHSMPVHSSAVSLGEALEQEYLRSIPIVSPDGIEAFLNWSEDLLR